MKGKDVTGKPMARSCKHCLVLSSVLKIIRVAILFYDVSNLYAIKLLFRCLNEAFNERIKGGSIALKHSFDRIICLIQHALHVKVNRLMSFMCNLQATSHDNSLVSEQQGNKQFFCTFANLDMQKPPNASAQTTAHGSQRNPACKASCTSGKLTLLVTSCFIDFPPRLTGVEIVLGPMAGLSTIAAATVSF